MLAIELYEECGKDPDVLLKEVTANLQKEYSF